MPAPISLIPLAIDHHADALQAIYQQTPTYWEMYNLPGVPPGQAARDLAEAEKTPGRTMMGIAQRLDPLDPSAGAHLVGLLDFRLGWPAPHIAYLGMIMVAHPYQRQGIGRRAWRMWLQWLRRSSTVDTVRIGVEQFNPGALQFFKALGFQMTGQADRIRAGDTFVRLLYMEYALRDDSTR